MPTILRPLPSIAPSNGERQRFTSRILPPYMRRSPQVAEVLPLLHLRGLSTGDFQEALPVLLGEDVAGPESDENIARLTAAWGHGVPGVPAPEPVRMHLGEALFRRVLSHSFIRVYARGRSLFSGF